MEDNKPGIFGQMWKAFIWGVDCPCSCLCIICHVRCCSCFGCRCRRRRRRFPRPRPSPRMDDNQPEGLTCESPAVQPDPNPTGQTQEDPRSNIISPSRPLTQGSSSCFDRNATISPMPGSSARVIVEQLPHPLPLSPSLESEPSMFPPYFDGSL